HGGEARLRAQTAAHRVAVEARHVAAEKPDRDTLRAGGLECGPAVVEGQRRESAGADRLGEQQAAEILVVGDDRDACRCDRVAHALARRRIAESSAVSAGWAAASR